MAIYGYTRFSTTDQDNEIQVGQLRGEVKYKWRSNEYGKHLPIVKKLLEVVKWPSYISQQLNINRTTIYKIKNLIKLDGQIAMDL